MKTNFELSDEKKINSSGVELFRIKVKKKFTNKFEGDIEVGSIGGWVDNIARVSGNAWVYGDAEVYGNAGVYGNCKIKIILCSKFNFEFQWQVEEWVNLEKEFEKKLKEKR